MRQNLKFSSQSQSPYSSEEISPAATSKHYREYRDDVHNQPLRGTHVRKSERMGDNLKER